MITDIKGYGLDLAPWLLECMAVLRPLPPDLGSMIGVVLGTHYSTAGSWPPAGRVRILAALRRLYGYLSDGDIAWVRRELLPRLPDDAMDPGAAQAAAGAWAAAHLFQQA
ncbi:hypothetical protein AB0M20_13730 [Actinoplanes sp. NPDC051633]|uniref:hypothetical protein n=1 Tax=Actinoplanes sp. NPDC051633 TaxID=3155670 RepID=UPI0034359445